MADADGSALTLGRPASKGAFARVAVFLGGVGLPLEVRGGVAEDEVGLHGGRILAGSDDDGLAGDVLHHAGRLALVPGRFRPMAAPGMADAEAAMLGYVDGHPDGVDDDPVVRACLQCGDTEASAWAYAAAVAAGVDTRLPFHRRLCRSGAEIHWMLSMNAHGGVNGLQAAGMTSVRARPGMPAFPAMARWLAVE